MQPCLVVANLTHQMDPFTNLLGSIYFNPSRKLIGQMCKIPADQSNIYFFDCQLSMTAAQLYYYFITITTTIATALRGAVFN